MRTPEMHASIFGQAEPVQIEAELGSMEFAVTHPVKWKGSASLLNQVQNNEKLLERPDLQARLNATPLWTLFELLSHSRSADEAKSLTPAEKKERSKKCCSKFTTSLIEARRINASLSNRADPHSK
jgi:hypothetical protein